MFGVDKFCCWARTNKRFNLSNSDKTTIQSLFVLEESIVLMADLISSSNLSLALLTIFLPSSSSDDSSSLAAPLANDFFKK